MKKQRIAVLVGAALLAAVTALSVKKSWRGIVNLAAALAVLILAHMSYAGTVNANWLELELPPEQEVVCAVQLASRSPLGDGPRYHVLRYDPEELSDFRDWAPADGALLDKAEKIQDRLEIPQEEREELAGCGAWYTCDDKGCDELILFWDGDAGLLYVLEDYL